VGKSPQAHRSHTKLDVVDRGFRAYLTPTGRSRGPRTDDHELHVDADLICPRCLTWIDPADFVRHNRLGLVQHEAC
jgi:hypothetical protein